MTPAQTEALVALAALVERWRAREVIHENIHRDKTLGRQARNEAAGEARTAGLCANELDAVIQKLAASSAKAWADFLAEWVDYNHGKGNADLAWQEFLNRPLPPKEPTT